MRGVPSTACTTADLCSGLDIAPYRSCSTWKVVYSSWLSLKLGMTLRTKPAGQVLWRSGGQTVSTQQDKTQKRLACGKGVQDHEEFDMHMHGVPSSLRLLRTHTR